MHFVPLFNMYNIYLFQIIFYLLLVLTITTFAKTDLNQDQVLKILYEAIDFQQNNNFEKAIEKYNYILQRYPNHPDALHLSGIAHHYIGGRKINHLAGSVSGISPNLLQTYKKNEKIAEQLVRQAILVKPSDSNFYNTLGEIIRLSSINMQHVNYKDSQLGRLEESLSVYRNGIDVLMPGFLKKLTSNPVRELQIYDMFNLNNNNNDNMPEGAANTPALSDLMKNYGLALMQTEDIDYTVIYYENLVKLNPKNVDYQFNLAMNLRRKKNDVEYARAYNVFNYIVEKHPNIISAKMQLAITCQMQGRIGDAINIYNEIIKVKGNDHGNDGTVKMDESFVQSLDDVTRQTIMVNLGAAHQESGHFHKAIYLYQRNLKELPNDARAWNNLGSSLWQIGDAQKSVDAYMKAIDIDPTGGEAYVNLGVAYYEYGNIEKCTNAYETAYNITKNDGLLMRLATMTLPIMTSMEQIKKDRHQLKTAIMKLYNRIIDGTNPVYLDEPVKDIERVHFYYLYHGKNEIFNQIMMCNLYFNSAKHVLPFVSNYLSYKPYSHTLEALNLPHSDGKIVVGFVSKFLVINHAHGQLLEGIVQHLDRNIFYIVALVIPNPQNVLLPSIANSADYVIRLPFALKEVRGIISDLKLDILVFADMLSEPLTYFMGLGSRMAPIQCLFWGNPVTSGTPDNIDYFITGEWMEEEGMGGRHDTYDPRTKNTWMEREGGDHRIKKKSLKIASQYTEQSVRLRGQGIWYDKIPIPLNINDPYGFETVNSEDMILPWQNEPGTLTYICAQSLFKLHPHYDTIIQKILEATPNSYLVLLQGRRQTWTEMIKTRMKSTMTNDVFKRIFFTRRVGSSNDYLRVLNKADIILHPFPFGGSKTSADGILLNKPTVVLVTDKLRCRMAFSYFVTMGIYDTVVYTEDDYVRKAVELGLNEDLRNEIGNKMKLQSHKIWERMEVIDAWSRFFQRAYLGSRSGNFPAYNRKWNGEVKSRKEFESNVPPPPPPPPHAPPPSTVPIIASSNNLATVHVDTMEKPAEEEKYQEEDNAASVLDILAQNAQVAFRQGNPIKAEEIFRKILLMDPSNPYVRNDLAAVLKHQRRLKESEHEFLRAIELKPDYTTAMANLGVIRHEMYDFEGAKEMYELVLKLDKTNLNALYNLGNYYRDTNQVKKAVALYVNHLELNYKGYNYILLLSMMNFRDKTMLFDIAMKYLYDNNKVEKDLNVLHEVTRLSNVKYDEAINNLCKLSQDVGLFDVDYDFDTGLPIIIDELLTVNDFSINNIDDDDGYSGLQLHLFMQYYIATDNERQNEIDKVLFYNLQNNHFEKVHCFIERSDRNWKRFFINKFIEMGYKNVTDLVNNKIQLIYTSGKRLRYDMALEYSYQYLDKNVIVVLSNSDIYFDSSIILAKKVQHNEVYTLLRYESGDMGKKKLIVRIDQQDVWIYHSKLLEQVSNIGLFMFELGRPRCDTRVAMAFTEENLIVKNVALNIKSHHVQENPRRTYTNEDQIPGELKYSRLEFL